MSQAPYAVRNARWGTAFGQDLKVHVCTCSVDVIHWDVLSNCEQRLSGLSVERCVKEW